MLAGVGCKDYDDDIDDLKGQINDLKGQVELKADASALKAVTDKLNGIDFSSFVTNSGLQTELDKRLADYAKKSDLKDWLTSDEVLKLIQAQGYQTKDEVQKLIDEAVRVAEAAPVVLLCVGLDEIAESEGMDRSNMELSKGQRELIEAVCKVNRNVVLVLSGGSPFVIPGSFRAAIHGYLGGQAGAGAMADALLGKGQSLRKAERDMAATAGGYPRLRLFSQ